MWHYYNYFPSAQWNDQYNKVGTGQLRLTTQEVPIQKPHLAPSLRKSLEKLGELHGQGDLGVFLGQLFELHAGRPLMSEQLKKKILTITVQNFETDC